MYVCWNANIVLFYRLKNSIDFLRFNSTIFFDNFRDLTIFFHSEQVNFVLWWKMKMEYLLCGCHTSTINHFRRLSGSFRKWSTRSAGSSRKTKSIWWKACPIVFEMKPEWEIKGWYRSQIISSKITGKCVMIEYWHSHWRKEIIEQSHLLWCTSWWRRICLTWTTMKISKWMHTKA